MLDSRGTIILSIFDWGSHTHGHSDMQLASLLAKSGPVLFVNSIGMRAPTRNLGKSLFRRISRKLRSVASAAFRPISDLDLVVFTPVFFPAYSGLLGQLNNKALHAQVSHFSRKLGFVRPVVLVTLPTFANLALSLERSILLYNRSDRHADFKFSNAKLVAAKEDLLFREANAVLYASRSLYDSETGRASGRSVFIGHGVDLERFSPRGPVAAELAAIPSPRVGFFGDLREHAIDFPLLAKVAHAMPNVQFVLGGSQLDDLSALRGLPNIHLLSACPHVEMPARWRGLDVAILPYQITPWTRAIEPIKLNEIAAIGLRAVGTRLPAFAHRGVVIADTVDEFVGAVSEALHPSQQVRPVSGELRSWETIVSQIEELIASLSSECETAV